MANKYEVGVFINPKAHKDIRAKGTAIKGAGVYHDVIPPAVDLYTVPKKIIVGGGERSNGTFINVARERGDDTMVGLLGGGSNDVLRKALVRAGRKMSVEQFLDLPPDEFPDDMLFYPGQAGGEIFNNQMGFGAYELWSGKLNESLRLLPKRMRTIFAKVAAYPPAVTQDGSVIDMYSIAPNIGQVPAFPDQDLFGSDVTHAWVEGSRGEQAKKLAITLASWQRRRQPSPEVLRTRMNDIFIANPQSNEMWIDGDTFPNTVERCSRVKRVKKPIMIVALE